MTYSTHNKVNEQQQNNSTNQTATAQFADNRASTAAQLKQHELMSASPDATAQRAVINTMNTSAVQQQKIIQRMEPEEELQLKAIPQTAQLADMDEEELLQGKFETAQRVKDEELLQGKFETSQRAEDEELLQGKFEPVQRAEKPNNTGLPDNLKSGIENLSGMSMDHLKVHYNSEKPAQLQAHAYAQGSEIHVAPGQEKHLPHEAWHVVQQTQGRVRPTVQMKGGVEVNDDVGLEREADVMGARATQLSGGTGKRQDVTPDAARHGSRATAGDMKSEYGEVAQLLMTAAAFQASTQTGLGAVMGLETRPGDVSALDTMIANYHALPAPATQVDAHARLAALHQIQTSIHQHFNQRTGLHASGHRAGMLALLDDVRVEHQAQIQQLVANNFAPWVPNRATLPAPEIAEMDTTWANVTNLAVAGGQLAINDEALSVADGTRAAVPGFRDEIHAHLARLLHTDTGRRLLHGLDNGAHAVHIEPTYRGIPRDQAEGMVKAYGAEQPGLDQETPAGGPGGGSESVVRMLPGATDHEMVDFNARDEPILSPAHIGVGHELIHALHNQRGVAWAANTHTPALYAQGGARAHYHNPEEYHTIAHPPPLLGPVPLEQLTENMLRAESNLPEREGHTGGRLADVSWSRWRQSWHLNGGNPRG